jgi:hypothetical protein
MVRQNRLHPRERFILLEIEKGYNKYMEEEDYIHYTLLPALTHCCCSCCHCTSLHFAAFPSLPFWERLQHNIPLRAYQSCSVRNDFSSLTPRLTTPPQMNIPKCDSHWVFQCDHKLTTLPRVYSSRSCACPLFHPWNHALLLRESLALSPKSPGSSPPLTMWAAH